MNTFFYLLALSIAYCATAQQAKTPLLLKSTITSVGSSTVSISKGKYTVLQSIGQSGIVGEKEFKNTTTVQQGFLNNILFFNVNNSDIINFQKNLGVVISPNPFINYIKINFSSKTQYPIYLKIYDISGKVFVNKKYQASKTILIPLENFSIGIYIIRIVSGKNKYIKKILKA